jgi:hypothetical protein
MPGIIGLGTCRRSGRMPDWATIFPAWGSMLSCLSQTPEIPRVRSWITPKAAKGGASAIEGRGVHAVEAIAGGQVVAVKGGHIVDGLAAANLPEAIRNSAFRIAADHFLAAVATGEYEGVMMLVNHSCEPNVGMGRTFCW